MTKFELLLNYFLGPLAVVVVLFSCLTGLNLLLNRMQEARPERTFHRQVVMLVATLIALVLLVILLPVSEATRGQILSLLGIVISATIALSATTFLGNALAGVLLRNVRSFQTGDFIYINDQFGRVSARGLFHIEIQTHDRDLVTLPNLYVTNNPVKVTRESGTIVSAEISLGYDVPHNQIEALLLQAATDAGLQDPFVYIIRLGDFSVLYRANGMLTDVKQLLSVRSRLNGAILDSLHLAGVEIVSPNFMNTRDVTGRTFSAQPLIKNVPPLEGKGPEEIIFDKADQAASLEEQKACLEEMAQKLAVLEEELATASNGQKNRINTEMTKLQRQQSQLQNKISINEKGLEEKVD